MRAAEERQANDVGFSLMELMVAIVVITFGLVSIVGISAYVSRANGTANILSVLTTAAQDQADKLRAASWSVGAEDPKLTVGGDLNHNSSDNNHRATVTDTPAGTLNVSWKVLAGPGTTGDMRTITIKVVQVNPVARLAGGFTVTILVSQS